MVAKKLTAEQKETLSNEILTRINNGSWGLKHVEYLYQNQNDYGLTSEELNLYVLHVYRYTYNMAMADGEIEPDEMKYLNQIKQLYNHHNPPTSVAEVTTMKHHINALTQNFKYNQKVKAINDVDSIEDDRTSLKKSSENLMKKQLKLQAAAATALAAERRRKLKQKADIQEAAEAEAKARKEEEATAEKRRYLPKYPRPKLTPFSTGNFW